MPTGHLPSQYQSLMGTHTGASFRAVAKVVSKQLPQPQAGEVVVKISYAGVNGGCETFRARGEHWCAESQLPLSATAGLLALTTACARFQREDRSAQYPLGAEGTGIVAALGPEVDSLQVGQAVACSGSGAFSEFVLAKAAMCYPVHAASREACAAAVSGLTAAAALEVTSPVQPGETALITAAGGATGSFGVQIARLAGAHVIATCGSQRKSEVLRDLGAHRIINYHEEDVARVLEQEYPKGIDVAYEGVGGSLRETVVQHLAPKGRLLGVGYISGYPHTTGYREPGAQQQQSNGHAVDKPSEEEAFWGRKTTHLPPHRTIFGNVWPGDREKLLQAKRRLFERLEQGTIRAVVDDRDFHGLESTADAVDYMLTGQAVGKVVVSLV